MPTIMTQPKNQLGKHQSTTAPIKQPPLHGVSPHTIAHPLLSKPVLTASQHKDQSQIQTCQQQSRLDNNRKAHKIHTRKIPLEHLAQVRREIATLGLTKHPLYRVTLPRLRDITDLPNT